MSSLRRKNISLYQKRKSGLWSPLSRSDRGTYRDRHERGAGCDGRGRTAGRAARTRTAKSCGPDSPTLGSSSWTSSRVMAA